MGYINCYFKDVYKIVAIYVDGLKLLFKNVKIKSVLMREVHSLTGSTREVKFNHYFPLIRLFPHKLGVDISRHQLASHRRHRQWSSRSRNVRLARGDSTRVVKTGNKGIKRVMRRQSRSIHWLVFFYPIFSSLFFDYHPCLYLK